MAKFLISTRSDDRRGYFLRIEADGFMWGTCESREAWVAAGNDLSTWTGNSVLVSVPGIDPATVQDLTSPQMVDDSGAPSVDANGNPVIFRMREWRIAPDQVPADDITLTADQIRPMIQRIRDGAAYTGL